MTARSDRFDPLAPQPIFDPEAVPHDPEFVSAEARGRAVAAEELRPNAIRHRFATPPPWRPELRADMRVLYPERAPRAASVLIPLVAYADDLRVLLTVRTAHLNDHAGQISFPGGRVESGDADAIATALRETHEEIGLPAARVDVVGTLPEYFTATGYNVTPVIGFVNPPLTPVLDAFEVSEVFEVPLAFLMDPAHHERRVVVTGDTARTFYAMQYSRPAVGTSGRNYFIWGATAAMLRNLYHFLRAGRAPTASTIKS